MTETGLRLYYKLFKHSFEQFGVKMADKEIVEIIEALSNGEQEKFIDLIEKNPASVEQKKAALKMAGELTSNKNNGAVLL